MARKMNSLMASQEACGWALAGNRQQMPPTAALYLAQLRSRILKVPPPGLRQQIAIQIEERPQAPRVVKIIHADSI
jgi:hypothetical protein